MLVRGRCSCADDGGIGEDGESVHSIERGFWHHVMVFKLDTQILMPGILEHIIRVRASLPETATTEGENFAKTFTDPLLGQRCLSWSSLYGRGSASPHVSTR